MCLSVVGASGLSVQAQVAEGGATGGAEAFSVSKPRLAMQAFGWVRDTVRSWAVLGVDQEDPVPGIASAAVTLRLGGKIVGRGGDAAGDGRSLVRALREARSEALRRLPIDRDATYEQRLADAARRITISMELGGKMVLMDAASLQEVAMIVAPGLEGVAVRLGDTVQAVFPEAMLISRINAGQAVAGLISEVSGNANLAFSSLSDLRDQSGLRVYRFETMQIAQPAPGEPGTFMHRGGKVVPMSSMTIDGLVEFADGLAQHLMHRRWPGVEPYGMFGTMDPVQGRFTNGLASPLEQATCAYSLIRYASLMRADKQIATRATAQAHKLMRDLAKVLEDEPDPASDVASAAMCAVVLMNMSVQDSEQGLAGLSRRCNAKLDEALAHPAGVDERVLPLVAWAIAMRVQVRPGEFEGAQQLVRELFLQSLDGQVVGMMPWLGWAELAISKGEPEVPVKVALERMRDRVWAHQLTVRDAGDDSADLVGGIVFTKSSNPLPSWNTARAVAFLATMLGDPRLTAKDDQSGQIVKLLGSLRFLKQLSAREAETHMYTWPGRARWGVRAALWDQEMPVQASALTLLCLIETLESLDQISSDQSE